jgi:hypothetical protein
MGSHLRDEIALCANRHIFRILTLCALLQYTPYVIVTWDMYQNNKGIFGQKSESLDLFALWFLCFDWLTGVEEGCDMTFLSCFEGIILYFHNNNNNKQKLLICADILANFHSQQKNSGLARVEIHV